MTMLRAELQELKRPQLQSLAKHHGLKANDKSIVIVDKLLLLFPDGVPPIDNLNPGPRASRPPTANANTPTVPPQTRAQEARPITSETRSIAPEIRAIVTEPLTTNANAPIILPSPTAPETRPIVPETRPNILVARRAPPKPHAAERPSPPPRQSIRQEERPADARRPPSRRQSSVPATIIQTPRPGQGASRSPPNSHQRTLPQRTLPQRTLPQRTLPRQPPIFPPFRGLDNGGRTLPSAAPYDDKRRKKCAVMPSGPVDRDKVVHAIRGLYDFAEVEKKAHETILELRDTVAQLRKLADETRSQVQAESVRLDRLHNLLAYFEDPAPQWTWEDVYKGTCKARPLPNGEGFEEVGNSEECSSDIVGDEYFTEHSEDQRNDQAHNAPRRDHHATLVTMDLRDVYGIKLTDEMEFIERLAKRSHPPSEDDDNDEARPNKRSRAGPSTFTSQEGAPLPPAMSLSATTRAMRSPSPHTRRSLEDESTVLSMIERSSKDSTNGTNTYSRKGDGSPEDTRGNDSLIYRREGVDRSQEMLHALDQRTMNYSYDHVYSSQEDSSSSPPRIPSRDKGKQRAIE